MSCRERCRRGADERSRTGSALVIVLLSVVLLTAVGTGMLFVATTDDMSAANLRDARVMIYAAQGAVERATAELASVPDWGAVLDGSLRSSRVDGPPTGARTLPGGRVIVLESVASEAACGRISGCTAAQMDAVSEERPWGLNNPRWQLYSYGPATAAGQTLAYTVVLVGDDGAETDGNPARDGPPGSDGAGVILLRGEAFGPTGAHRVVEAVVGRAEAPAGAAALRVVAWRELR